MRMGFRVVDLNYFIRKRPVGIIEDSLMIVMLTSSSSAVLTERSAVWLNFEPRSALAGDVMNPKLMSHPNKVPSSHSEINCGPCVAPGHQRLFHKFWDEMSAK